MKTSIKVLLPAVLALALPVLIMAADSEAVVGTWTLNIAKSDYKSNPAPRSETRTYESTPDGIRLTVHQVAADGNALTETSTYKYDGKPYAFTGSPTLDAVAVTRINGHERRSTDMLHGKVTGHVMFVISKDGKTMTATRTVKGSSGKTEVHDIRVYDRQ